jgi:hypothetical protein
LAIDALKKPNIPSSVSRQLLGAETSSKRAQSHGK